MKVFVYGTLKSGHGNNRVLGVSKKIGDVTTAKNFRMYSNGYFPMIIRDKDGYKITGELYEADEFTIQRLDRLEGVPHLYHRDSCTVIDCDGKKIQAYVYIYSNVENVRMYSEVSTGNWRHSDEQ